MTTIDDLLAQVEAKRDEIIKLEQELVRIPSVNTGFMPTGNETPVCELAQGWLAKDGIESEILGSAPGRGNPIARMEGRSGKAGLFFMSHADVAPVEEGLEVSPRLPASNPLCLGESADACVLIATAAARLHAAVAGGSACLWNH